MAGGGGGDKRRAPAEEGEAPPPQKKPKKTDEAEKGKGKGKRGEKGKGKGTKTKKPAELKGKWDRTPEARALCWNFDTAAGCNGAAPGGTCQRGVHLCAEPNCQQPHSLVNHR